MSNEKLDPRSLTSEERAIVDRCALFYRQFDNGKSERDGETAAWAYVEGLEEAEPLILARRAIFGEPASEGGKVEYLCPYCGVATDGPTHLRKLEHGAEWTCNRRCSNCHAPSGDHELCERCESILKRQPAQPESVAAEMPEAVREAARILRVASKGYVGFTVSFLNSKADALESFWRTHAAQPANAVAMTEELERCLREKVRMPKVRIALDTMRAHFEPNCQGQCRFPMVWEFCIAALAELDAAEGRK